MLIRNKKAIEDFVGIYSNSRNPMASWIQKVEFAQWHTFRDIRFTFNTASYVKPWVIFNVGGNKYRIQAEIIYQAKIVRIARVGTHEEYNKWLL